VVERYFARFFAARDEVPRCIDMSAVMQAAVVEAAVGRIAVFVGPARPGKLRRRIARKK